MIFVILTLSLLVSTAEGHLIRDFSATANPDTSNMAETKSYALTIKNEYDGSNSLGYAAINIPLGFAVNSLSVPDAGGKFWSAMLVEV